MTKISKYSFSPKAITRDEFLTPFDRVFDDMMSSLFPAVSTAGGLIGSDFFSKGSYPKVNIINNDTSVVLEAAVPGLTKEDVSVEVQDRVLTVSGSKNQKSIEASAYVKREIKRSSFKRSFALGDNLDIDNITGFYDLGILTLQIPKVVPEASSSARKTIKIS